MEKEFIPYEQALALKELGFDEECLGTYYEEDKSFYINGVSYSNSYFTKAQELIPEHPTITTPLYQQAFRWFREKYEIVGIVKFGTQEFTYNIYNNDAIGLLTKDSLDFNGTYEEAEIACLKKLIEIVKNK